MHPLARPGPQEPCLCGSGALSARCCGALPAGCAPRGLSIQRGFLSPETCRRLVTYATSTGREPMMQDTKAGRIRSEERVGYLVDVDAIEQDLNDIVARAYETCAAGCGVKAIAWFQRPQLLAYGAGGRYITHADADAWDAQAKRWRKVVDRDLSLLLYLDQQFSGGALYFPRFDYRLQPEAGMLVMFPSDARYAHCAEPVIQGQRHVIVSWAAAQGVSRVQAAPPADAIPVVP